MVDAIELDRVVVAVEEDAVVRGVMDVVVGHPVTDTSHFDGGAIGPLQPGVVVHVIVGGHVPRGRERGPVAAVEHHAPLAHLVDVAADHLVPAAPLDEHAPAAGVAEPAATHRHALAPRDLHEAVA